MSPLMKTLTLIAGCMLLLASGTALASTTASASSIQDTWVTPGPGDTLTGDNFGMGGSLEISGTGLSKGQAQAIMTFDLAPVKTAFDTAYGADQWRIDSVTVRLTATAPANAIYNAPTAAGLIQVRWTPTDTWVEGTGTPALPSLTGLNWQTFAPLTVGAENEGVMHFDGTLTTADHPLVPSSGLLGDIAAGSTASLIFSAADTTVTGVFNTHEFAKGDSARPSLIVTASAKPPQTDIHGPEGSHLFGFYVTVLPNGNIVVPDSSYSIPSGASNVGAVHLYAPDGTHVSTLTGSTAGDQVGGSIVVLANGSYVVVSPNWGGGMGAVTWCDGGTGVNGVVSSSNSLVGSNTSDRIGTNPQSGNASVFALTNGNYVVASGGWKNGSAQGAGAVTWCSGTTGRTGTISAANSLVGSTAGDNVGAGAVAALPNGNYVVASPFWSGGASSVGAVTWGDGAAGVAGAVSATNSLVGSSALDQVGAGGITVLTNGNYVVSSYLWKNGANSSAGAVTWASGATGIVGPVSASNSLVGSTASDQVGEQGVTPLSNGNYVVTSIRWTNAGIAAAGAVTWGNGSGGTTGPVSASNSLVGSAIGDYIGGGTPGVFALTNGSYVVSSPHWHNAGQVDAGAATWCSGTGGTVGEVSSANSLVGSTAHDQVSAGGVAVLKNGNYVVSSPSWNGNLGAATWGSGTAGIMGEIASTNSLVGAAQGDQVGSSGLIPLANGNYVVASESWNSGAGAATWGNGSTGINGTVSDANSFVGTAPSSFVGETVTALTNGNYVVRSATPNGGATFAGAVTWLNGTVPSQGSPSAANSLTGTHANDSIGFVTPLADGNYVVSSNGWDRGSTTDAGAVTWCSGTQATSAVVSPANSIVGSQQDDEVSYIDNFGNGGVTALPDGRYVISSPVWDNGDTNYNTGAVTLGYGTPGNVGGLSKINGVPGTYSEGHPTTPPGNSARMPFAYDVGRGQLAVGRYRSSIVTLFNPTAGIEVYETATVSGNVTTPVDAQVPNGIQPVVVAAPGAAVGENSSVNFTIKNPGLGNLTGLTMTIDGPNGSDFSVTTQPVAPVAGPRGSTTFTVQFAPGSAGTKYGLVHIASNDAHGDSNFSFYVSGIASAPPPPHLSVDFLGLSDVASGSIGAYGTVNVGLGFSSTCTLKNAGPGTLNITSITVTGANAGDFLKDVDISGSTVNANDQASFGLVFEPSAGGDRTATLTLTTNDPDHPTFTILLTGTGVEVAGTIGFGAPVYTVNQGAVTASVVVTRTGGTLPTSVTINTANGTASSVPPFVAAVATGVNATSDYVALSGAATTVTFAQGDTASKTVNITLIPKSGAMPNKRFTANLSAPTAGATLGTSSTTVQILAADITKPTLTVTAPGTARTLSAASPYTVTGVAGDAHGIAKVEMVLNNGPVLTATLGHATVPTAVPFTCDIAPVVGSNTLVVTAYDLKGNSTSVTRNFTFTLRYHMTLQRSVPSSFTALPDNAGTVSLIATPATNATAFPVTANLNPKVSEALPGTVMKLTAAAKTACAFSGWSGLPQGAVTLGNVATFTMPASPVTVTATFVANPFGGAAGTGNVFQGLLHPAGGTASSNATEGFFTGALTASNGAFTGKILIDGVSQAVTATFYGDGSCLFTVGTTRAPTLTFGGRSLTLSYNAQDTRDQISVALTKDAAISSGAASRAMYSATSKLAASSNLLTTATSGYFTVALPSKMQESGIDASLYPQGSSYGTITLTSTGAVTFAGTLADGTAVTAASNLIARNACPVFAQQLTPGSATIKGGSFGGVFSFLSQADSDVTGTDLLWFRAPAIALAKPTAATNLYTNGWPAGIKSDAFGARYYSLVTAQTALNLGSASSSGNARLTFSHGKLAGDIVKTTFNIVKNAVTKIPVTDPAYSLLITPATGVFSGSFKPNWDSASKTNPPYKGIIIQKGVNRGGYGWFISNAVNDTDPESGKVRLDAQLMVTAH